MMRSVLGRIEGIVWGAREKPLPSWKVHGLRIVRTALILGRDLVHGELTLRAMSLVYTTLLSIVPLLALSFSVLKAFGVSDQIRPMLANLLAPLGEKGAEVTERIVQFIQNMNVGVLGALGLALLLYTAISLMHKIEESLNFIWHVPQSRRLGERFSRYLSVLLVGPILVFSALGLTATVMNFEAVRGLMELGMLHQTAELVGRLMPYVLVIGAFTFIYLFIPNTRVHYGPALVGGAVGGIAWQTAGWAFAIFAASSNRYSAIYSSFAILLLFMIWLYLSWLILLFGASVAFYAQHPEYLYARGGEPRLSNRMRERLALSIMSLVAGRFLAGEEPPSLEDFTRRLRMPMHALQAVLGGLEDGGLLATSGDEPARYLPARDPSLILATQVLDTVRTIGEERFVSLAGLPAPAPVDDMIERIRQAVESSVGDVTLRDLAAPQANAAMHHRDVPPAGPAAGAPRTDAGRG